VTVFGFVISRIEEMAFRTTYNPETDKGDVIVNISYFDKDDFETVINLISYTVPFRVYDKPESKNL